MTENPPPEFKASAIPDIAITRLESCAICAAQSLQPFAQGYDYELLTCRNLWQFEQCTGCGHLQLNPRPAESTLPIIYPPHYYSYDMRKSVGRVAIAGKQFLDRLKFSNILAAMDVAPTSYLDIGCGDMRYLDLMREKGLAPANIFGIELDDRIAELGRRKGYRVFNERLEAATSIQDNSLDLVTMFHVIEHIDDPGRAIRKIASWLRPGQLLVLETPNARSWDASLFRQTYWGGYHFPRHWHIFTPASMQRLLQDNGFTLEDIQFKPGHSFWLFSLHHWLRYNGTFPCPRLAQFFHPMKSLLPLMLVTGFEILRASLGFRTSSMLLVAKRRQAPPP